MNEQYYTPSIEEFHVGFEYESLHEWFDVKGKKTKEEWVKCKVESISDLINSPYISIEADNNLRLFEFRYDHVKKDGSNNPYKSKIRVKYLDRDDVELEGWVKSKPQSDFLLFKKGKYTLNLLDENRIFISNPNAISITGEIKNQHIFHGTIKNISEFRVLLKQLNIA